MGAHVVAAYSYVARAMGPPKAPKSPRSCCCVGFLVTLEFFTFGLSPKPFSCPEDGLGDHLVTF